MIEKKHTFALILISLAIASIATALSGITKDDILSAASFSGAGGKMDINPYLILLAAFALPLAYAAAAVYSLGLKNMEPDIALAPIVAVPLVFYFAGITLHALVFSAAIILSVFYAARTAFHDKEHYKKIDAGGVAKKAAGRGIFLLGAAVAFAVFFTLYSDPAYTQDAVDSMIKGISGLSIADMKNASQFAVEQQKQASYAWIENIEASVNDAVQANLGGMTPSEQAACQRTIDGQLSEIDRVAKQEIDRRLDSGPAGGGVDAAYLNTLISLLVSWYPLIMAVTAFAAVEFARTFFLAPLAGIYAWILWRMYGSSEA